jgi:urease accessory protein
MSNGLRRLLALGAMAGAAGPALAHHPMGGTTPATLADGFLSGLGHPVIGLDHLAFVVGVGILSAFVARGWRLPALFVGLGALGSSLHVAGYTLPFAELLIGLSVLFMAAAVYFRQRASFGIVAALCGLGGLAHGYALAESIVGAEPTPLAAYLVGLALVQFMIAMLVAAGMRALSLNRPIVADRAMLAASAGILAVGLAAQLWPA